MSNLSHLNACNFLQLHCVPKDMCFSDLHYIIVFPLEDTYGCSIKQPHDLKSFFVLMCEGSVNSAHQRCHFRNSSLMNSRVSSLRSLLGGSTCTGRLVSSAWLRWTMVTASPWLSFTNVIHIHICAYLLLIWIQHKRESYKRTHMYVQCPY